MKQQASAIPISNIKRCSQCSDREKETVLKPATIEYFRPDPKSSDGFRSNCRECDKLNYQKKVARQSKAPSKKVVMRVDKSDGSVNTPSTGDFDGDRGFRQKRSSDSVKNMARVTHGIRRFAVKFGVFALYFLFLSQSTLNGSFLFRQNFLTLTESRFLTELWSHLFAFSFVALSASLWYVFWRSAVERKKTNWWIYLVAAVLVQGIQLYLFQDSTRGRLVYKDFKEARQTMATRRAQLVKDLAFHEGVVERYRVNRLLTDRAWQDRAESKVKAELIRGELAKERRVEVEEPERTTVWGLLVIPEMGIVLCPLLLAFVREDL